MDPRAEHTRAELHRAVLELVAEGGGADLTVTDIVQRAAVNRSSFYQHFNDRDELLASALEEAEERAGRVHAPVLTGIDPDQPPHELISFLAHFAEHAAVYRYALGPQGSSLVSARVRARTFELVRDGIELSVPGHHAGLPLDIAAAGTAGALLGAVEAWLTRDPLPSPEVAATWIMRLLLPTHLAR